MTSRQLLTMVEYAAGSARSCAGIRVARSSGSARRRSPPPIPSGAGRYICPGLSMVDATTILAGRSRPRRWSLVVDGVASHDSAAARRRGDRPAIVAASRRWSLAAVVHVYVRGAAVVGELHRGGDPRQCSGPASSRRACRRRRDLARRIRAAGDRWGRRRRRDRAAGRLQPQRSASAVGLQTRRRPIEERHARERVDAGSATSSCNARGLPGLTLARRSSRPVARTASLQPSRS